MWPVIHTHGRRYRSERFVLVCSNKKLFDPSELKQANIHCRYIFIKLGCFDRERSYADAVDWYEMVVNTTNEDDGGEFDAAMDDPVYQLQAVMAQLYLVGGYGLEKDPSYAGVLMAFILLLLFTSTNNECRCFCFPYVTYCMLLLSSA